MTLAFVHRRFALRATLFALILVAPVAIPLAAGSECTADPVCASLNVGPGPHAPIIGSLERSLTSKVEQACSQAAGLCGVVNDTAAPVAAAIASLSPTPALAAVTIESPTPGEWARSPVQVRFSTVLPSVAGQGTGFAILSAPQGSGLWTDVAWTECAGQVERACITSFEASSGNVSLRVVYTNLTSTCRVGTCDTLDGIVHIDNEPPTTILGITQGVYTTSTAYIPYSFQDMDGASVVTLQHRLQGASAWTNASTSTNGTLRFTPPSTGTFELRTRGSDTAGNVEQKSVPDATVMVVDVLQTSAADVYVTEGEVALLRVCVRKGNVDVTSDSTATVSVDGGAPVPMTHAVGCEWTVPYATASSGVAVQRLPLSYRAQHMGLVGTTNATLVVTSSGYVVLDIAHQAIAQAGTDVAFDATVTDGATGLPREGIEVQILLDGTQVGTLVTSADGGALFSARSDVAATRNYTFVVNSVDELGEPILSEEVPATVAWTRLVSTSVVLENPLGFGNVRASFNVTVCIAQEHSGEPADAALLSILSDDDILFDGTTDEEGCAIVPISYAISGVHNFSISFTRSAQGIWISGENEGPIEIAFTQLVWSMSVDDALVAVDDPIGVTVCGQYEALDLTPGGALVVISTNATPGEVLAQWSLDDQGCAGGPIAFSVVYADDILADLGEPTPHGILAQKGPAVVSVVATEIIVDDVQAPTLFVNVGDPIDFRVPMRWAHNNSSIGAATINFTATFIDQPDRVVRCDLLGGQNATCPVVLADPFDGSLEIDVVAASDIKRVRDGDGLLTPRAIWTRVDAAGRFEGNSDAFAAVGEAIVFNYTAEYGHTKVDPTSEGEPVPFFNVTFSDACGFNGTYAGRNGYVLVSIMHEQYCQSAVHAIVVNATGGIVRQFPADLELPAPDENVYWTSMEINVSSLDRFVQVGDPLPLSGTVEYAISREPVDGTVDVRRADNNVSLGSIPIEAGVFNGTVSSSGVYHGALVFKVTEDVWKVGIHNFTRLEDATWSVVDLVASVNDTFTAIGSPVNVSGTATFAGIGSLVESGRIEVLDEQGAAIGTGDIVNGAWSASVMSNSPYAGNLTVRVVETTRGVLGDDVSTATVTWTRIELALVDAPSSQIVGVNASIQVSFTAEYSDGSPVGSATFAAFDGSGAILGTCEIVEGECSLTLVSHDVYAGLVTIRAIAGFSGVVSGSPLVVGPLIWTRLLIEADLPPGPYSANDSTPVVARVTWAHNGTGAQNVLVTFGNLSSGEQAQYTNATGGLSLNLVEPLDGWRNLSVRARSAALNVSASLSLETSRLVARWTSIGFDAFEYPTTAPRYHEGDPDPYFPLNTAVTVCTRAVAADDRAPLAGASVLLRGVQRTTNATGVSCITIGSSPNVRDVVVTAHGVSATIDGRVIRASRDRVVTLHFVADP